MNDIYVFILMVIAFALHPLVWTLCAETKGLKNVDIYEWTVKLMYENNLLWKGCILEGKNPCIHQNAHTMATYGRLFYKGIFEAKRVQCMYMHHVHYVHEQEMGFLSWGCGFCCKIHVDSWPFESSNVRGMFKDKCGGTIFL